MPVLWTLFALAVFAVAEFVWCRIKSQRLLRDLQADQDAKWEQLKEIARLGGRPVSPRTHVYPY
jgi:hypothetical protein